MKTKNLVFIFTMIALHTHAYESSTTNGIFVAMDKDGGIHSSPDQACKQYEQVIGSFSVTNGHAGIEMGVPVCWYTIDYLSPNFEDQEVFYQNWWQLVGYCNGGSLTNSGECESSAERPAINCPSNISKGNPVVVSHGIKKDSRIDWESNSSAYRGLRLERLYSSKVEKRRYSVFGADWYFSNYSKSLSFLELESKQYAKLFSNGLSKLWFELRGEEWYSLSDSRFTLIFDEVKQLWEITSKVSNEKEYYDVTGKLIQLEFPNAHSVFLSYSNVDTSSGIYELAKVSSGGLELDFEYDDCSRLIGVTTPDNYSIRYAYSDDGLLSTVSYNNNVYESYEYKNFLDQNNNILAIQAQLNAGIGLSAVSDEAAARMFYGESFVSSESENSASCSSYYSNGGFTTRPLIAIRDNKGNLFANYTYDRFGRVVSSTQSSNNSEYTFEYLDDGITEVTNYLGLKTKYQFKQVNHQSRLVSVEGEETETCAGTFKSYEYDTVGNLTKSTKASGIVNVYEYDIWGRKTKEISASDTFQEQMIMWQWDTDSANLKMLVEPERITEYTYDDVGRLLNTKVTPITP